MNFKLPQEQMDLSDYGVDADVYVRALTAAEEKQLHRLSNNADKMSEVNIYISARAAVNDDGSPVFTEKDLANAPGKMVRSIAEKCIELSGLTDENDEGKGD